MITTLSVRISIANNHQTFVVDHFEEDYRFLMYRSEDVVLLLRRYRAHLHLVPIQTRGRLIKRTLRFNQHTEAGIRLRR